jgi:hypothetical protein
LFFLEELEEGGCARVSQQTETLGRHRYSSNLKKFPSSETVLAIVSDLVAPVVVLAALSREQIAFTRQTRTWVLFAHFLLGYSTF